MLIHRLALLFQQLGFIFFLFHFPQTHVTMSCSSLKAINSTRITSCYIAKVSTQTYLKCIIVVMVVLYTHLGNHFIYFFVYLVKSYRSLIALI